MDNFTSSLLDRNNLNLVLDNLKVGIIAHTTERVVTVFNKEAERITGYTKAEAVGRDCHDIFQMPFCGQKCSFCKVDHDFKTELKEYSLSIITKDGTTKQVEMTVSPILDRNVLKGVLASFRDLTDSINTSLKAENLSNYAGIIGKTKAMQDIFRQIKDVALYNYPVHVFGETGTGKERVACAIHDISSYGAGAFVPVNCGAIPEGIVESELFGHVKGAFSGAVRERKGRFELAHQGTLFLDEVAELSLKTQVKLLRFLQEGTFEKVGDERKLSVDARIISASNKDLKEEVENGSFREDLFYRLNVIPIHLPPLRERKSDIPLLVTHFLKEAEIESKNKVPDIAGKTMELLLDYSWPGNVRELKNVIQFSVVRSKGDEILPLDLPLELVRDTQETYHRIEKTSLAQPVFRGKLDSASVKAALKRAGGNKSKAARMLSVGRATLYRFLDRHMDIKEFSNRF